MVSVHAHDMNMKIACTSHGHAMGMGMEHGHGRRKAYLRSPPSPSITQRLPSPGASRSHPSEGAVGVCTGPTPFQVRIRVREYVALALGWVPSVRLLVSGRVVALGSRSCLRGYLEDCVFLVAILGTQPEY